MGKFVSKLMMKVKDKAARSPHPDRKMMDEMQTGRRKKRLFESKMKMDL